VSVGIAVKLLRRPNAEPTIDSVGVLPFTTTGDDRVGDYLSDGLTEQLINNLSELPQLRVPARTTMFRYKGQSPEPQKVGSELGVGAILMGRVSKEENNLNIQSIWCECRMARKSGANNTRVVSRIFKPCAK